MKRLLVMAMALGIGGQAQAQQDKAEDWVRDMPTVAEVTQRIRGANTAQTLGRQCAVLTRLWRGRDLPPAYLHRPTPATKRLQETYSQGITAVRQRYNASVKPLDAAANKQEWDRMCSNYKSGVNPLTGKQEAGWPALDEPVTYAEWVALLRPAARAAVEAERQAGEQRAAANKTRWASEAGARATQERMERFEAFAGIGTMLAMAAVAVIIGALMLRLLMRTRWAPDGEGRQVRLRREPWDIQHTIGVVLAGHKDRETVVTGGAGGGGPNNAPVSLSISSYSIVHQEFRLAGPDGREHDIRLHDWDISAHPGDLLQLVQVARDGRVSPYVMITNWKTKAHWFNEPAMQQRIAPNPILALALVLGLGLVVPAVGWLIGGLWYWWTKRQARREAGDALKWLKALPPPVIDMAPA